MKPAAVCHPVAVCRSALYDQEDREFAQLLFVHRGNGMGVTFLNRRLIPLSIDGRNSYAVRQVSASVLLPRLLSQPRIDSNWSTTEHSIGKSEIKIGCPPAGSNRQPMD